MSMQLCPRCRTLLSAGDGVLLEDVCGGCRGRFLPPAATERVVVDELGVDRATLKEIAELFSGQRLPCPGCASSMRPLRLHGVHVDLCFSCGGLWLDGGELTSLSAGRHVEVGGTTPPVIELGGPSSSTTSKLGRGTTVVLFTDLDLVDEAALARAFAGTDGLTAIDARLIVGSGVAVVVEGVSVAGATTLVARLAVEGIGAVVVADTLLKVPAATASSSVVLDGDQIVLGFHTGPAVRIAFADIAGLAAGITKVESTVTRAVQPSFVTRMERGFGRDVLVDDSRLEVVATDVLTVEALIASPGEAPKHLRWSTPPVRRDVVVGLIERCRELGVPLGRCKIPGARGGWPRFNRGRDIERDAIHAAWRAGRWPASI